MKICYNGQARLKEMRNQIMDGILPLWKERGMTSHDCVFKLRKILHTKKVGHGGTLDPDVDGVLPICVGKGTKVIEYLQDGGKVYIGEITLGYSTTTEDKSGELVVQKKVAAPIETKKIDAAMQEMVGEITQIPPMYSAVKVKGKRLYEYARKGEEVERPKRVAYIESFTRTSEPVFDQTTGTLSWKFEVVCGKGTYVRTLAVDTGLLLGFPAHMSDLTRTKSAGLKQAEAYTLAQIKEMVEQENLSFLQPIERAMSQFTSLDLSEEQYAKVRNGVFLAKSLLADQPEHTENIALFYQGKVVSIYGVHPTKSDWLKPIKVLRNNLQEGKA